MARSHEEVRSLLTEFANARDPANDDFVVVRDGSPRGYFWHMLPGEAAAIAKVLEVGEGDITWKGICLNVPRMACGVCGKLAAVLDLLFSALLKGQHDKSILARGFADATNVKGPASVTHCSACSSPYVVIAGCASNFNYSYDLVPGRDA